MMNMTMTTRRVPAPLQPRQEIGQTHWPMKPPTRTELPLLQATPSADITPDCAMIIISIHKLFYLYQYNRTLHKFSFVARTNRNFCVYSQRQLSIEQRSTGQKRSKRRWQEKKQKTEQQLIKLPDYYSPRQIKTQYKQISKSTLAKAPRENEQNRCGIPRHVTLLLKYPPCVCCVHLPTSPYFLDALCRPSSQYSVTNNRTRISTHGTRQYSAAATAAAKLFWCQLSCSSKHRTW